jgi:hypothetical protein
MKALASPLCLAGSRQLEGREVDCDEDEEGDRTAQRGSDDGEKN